jgi:hypothetical protein
MLPTYKFLDRDIPIKLDYWSVTEEISPLGLDILELLGEHGERTVVKIVLDEQVMLNIWWYFIKDVFGDTPEQRKKCLQNLESLEKFKDILWEAIVNFLPPPVRTQLQGALIEARKQIKEASSKKEN